VPHGSEPHPDIHPDPDDLALVALGEHLDGSAAAHIADCSECRTQIESFQGTVGLAGLSDYGRDAPPPGEHVWHAISAELAFSDDLAGPGAAAETTPLLTSVPDLPGPPASEPGPPTAPTPAAPRPIAARRRLNRWVVPIAAAAAGIALGAGAVVLVQNRENSVTVDATATLTPVQGGPLPPTDGQLGTAELVTARQGQEVRVDASALPAAAARAYEVWLFGLPRHAGRRFGVVHRAGRNRHQRVPDDRRLRRTARRQPRPFRHQPGTRHLRLTPRRRFSPATPAERATSPPDCVMTRCPA
jgi:hypothetical protein